MTTNEWVFLGGFIVYVVCFSMQDTVAAWRTVWRERKVASIARRQVVIHHADKSRDHR